MNKIDFIFYQIYLFLLDLMNFKSIILSYCNIKLVNTFKSVVRRWEIEKWYLENNKKV
jgi:hypothetical protein